MNSQRSTSLTLRGFQNAGSARERSVVALSSLGAPLRGAIHRFMCARGYQILLGLATEGLPLEAKALAFAALGVRR